MRLNFLETWHGHIDLWNLQSSGFDQNEISTDKNGGITDQTRAFPLQNLAFPMLAGMGQNNRKSWAIRHWWCQVFTPKRNHKTKWEWTVLRTPDLDGEFAYCFSFGWKQTAAEHCRRWHTTTLRTGLLPLDTLRDAKEIGYCFGEPLPTGPNCFEIWCASLYSIYI